MRKTVAIFCILACLYASEEKGQGCTACQKPRAGEALPDGTFLDCNYRNSLKDCYQPPLQVKCCDQACPKCLGGIAPMPGNNGCLYGCPDGGSCPGTCPCDECVCCYTTTKWLTETSTCMDVTTEQVVQLDTSTEERYFSTVKTLTVPVTFTVEDIFSFTSVMSETRYPVEPTLITTTIPTFETEESSVFASTGTVYAALYIFNETEPVTEDGPNEVTVTDDTQTDLFTLPYSILISTVTKITAFSYDFTGYAATSSVVKPGTFYLFEYPDGTYFQVTTTIQIPFLSSVPVSATETIYDCRTGALTCPVYVPTYTEEVYVTPTTTLLTTVPLPPYFNLPFFPNN